MLRGLIVIGMIAIGVLVWKLLKRQEPDGAGEHDEHDDRFGW